MNHAHLRSHVTPILFFTLVLPVALAAVALGPAMSPCDAGAADPPPYEGEWGFFGTGNGEFDSPRGLAISEAGELYVADTDNHRIQKFDLDGNYLAQWGSAGMGTSQFNTPSGVAAVWFHFVFVADSGNDRIQKFDTDGTFVGTWGTSGSGAGQFQYPIGIAYSYWFDEVYVVDHLNNRIQHFDTDGNYGGEWGTSGSGDGQFDMPTAVAATLDGRILVLDTGNHRVQVFSATGLFLGEWGTAGTDTGQFNAPTGIGTDCEDNVYVADTGNHRIQVFSVTGNFITEWGAMGSGPGEFNSPSGVAGFISQVVPVGGKRALTTPLYVLDSGNSRVQQFMGPCCAAGFCDSATATVAGPATVMVSPSGTGPTLASLDATVTVQILDCCDQGIAGYPFQDIWLDDNGTGDIALCQGGSVADANTDVDGITTISGAPAAGGWTLDGMRVYLAGMPIDAGPLPLSVNSPDLNGDLVVDLVDLGAFAIDYNNVDYDFRADLTGDGIENLADVGAFAPHYDDACP